MAQSKKPSSTIRKRESLLARLFIAPIGADFSATVTFRIRTFAVLFIPYMFAAFALMGYLSLRPAPTPFVASVGWIVCAFLGVAYVIARTHWHRLGVWIVVAAVWIGFTATLCTKFDGPRFLVLFPYLTLATVTASLFLGSVETLVVALGVTLTGVLLLTTQLPPEMHAVGVRAGVFLFMTSGLASIARYHFSWLERHKRRLAEELKEKEVRLELARSLETIGKLSAIGEMATAVADEIKSPLEALAASTEHIQLEVDVAGNDLQIMRTSIERIGKIVSNLQTMATSALGEPLAMHSLTSIVRNAVEFSKDKAVRHKVALWFDEAADHPIECYGGEILQAIVNLLRNAIDGAAAQEDRWVELRIEEAPDCYTIVVMDSGNGIPEDVRAHLMRSFYTSKPAGRGTGLGLPLTRWVAERHGGSLELVADAPQTTFALRLARRFADSPETLTSLPLAG